MKPSAQRMLFWPIAENRAKATSLPKVFILAAEAIAFRGESRIRPGAEAASPRRLSDRQLHVRDRDRKQHPDDQSRQDPHRRDGGLRSLSKVARGFRLRG